MGEEEWECNNPCWSGKSKNWHINVSFKLEKEHPPNSQSHGDKGMSSFSSVTIHSTSLSVIPSTAQIHYAQITASVSRLHSNTAILITMSQESNCTNSKPHTLWNHALNPPSQSSHGDKGLMPTSLGFLHYTPLPIPASAHHLSGPS